jgi:tryptophan-rich sensory protein
MNALDFIALVSFIAACLAAASTGAIFRPGRWYEGLAKPDWRPPNWAFAPVWTVLYLTIAVAGWLVWRKVGASLPLYIYILQLVLNAAWTPIFFGLHRLGAAFLEIVLLWVSIALTIVFFYPVDLFSAWLLVPYLTWVTFASALNHAIWRLNRQRPNNEQKA